MPKKDSIEIHSKESSNKVIRDQSRWTKLNHATHILRKYFEDSGDSKAQSKTKLDQLSTEASEMGGEPIMNYILGNKQPLKDKINASVLSFMDATAKSTIVNKL